jgi:hypothetical protein
VAGPVCDPGHGCLTVPRVHNRFERKCTSLRNSPIDRLLSGSRNTWVETEFGVEVCCQDERVMLDAPDFKSHSKCITILLIT